jgi:Ca2+/Na+ antiporter
MRHATCNVFVNYTAVPALPPLQVCVSVALVQFELWLPENPNGSIYSRDQVNNSIINIINIIIGLYAVICTGPLQQQARCVRDLIVLLHSTNTFGAYAMMCFVLTTCMHCAVVLSYCNRHRHLLLHVH